MPQGGHVIVKGKNPQDPTAFASLRASMVLKTQDGGETWEIAWLSTNFEIRDLETADPPWLQAATNGSERHPDGDFCRSEDGGENWNLVRGNRTTFAIRKVEGKRWVAVGVSRMIFQEDLRRQPGLEPTYPEAMKEPCRALYSDDGGRSWKPCKGSNQGQATCGSAGGDDVPGKLRALAVQKGRPVLAVGDVNVVLRSLDGGRAWEAVPSATKQSLYGVAWCGETAVAVGKEGTVVVGTDRGKRWAQSATGRGETLFAAVAAGDEVVIVGENGTALRAKTAESIHRRKP